ncbi:MAG: hypothetical protein WCF12_05460, partial [Propionicimonas sp.]
MPPLRTRAMTALCTASLVAVVGVGASACTASPVATAGWSPAAAGNGNPGSDAVGSITKERVTAAIAALPAYIKTVMEASGVPGLSVAVVYQDETVFA